MTRNDVLESALRLQREGTAYALVTVLRAAAPTSAQPGDKAVVTADGAITGWIGGGCAQPVVVRTVRRALADGKAQVIRIAPDDERGSGAGEASGSLGRSTGNNDEGGDVSGGALGTARGGMQLGEVLEFGMACHSGGTLELFIDPVLPQPQLVIFGSSPVAVALSQLAPRVGFAVTVVAHGVVVDASGARSSSDFPDAVRVLANDEVSEVARAAPQRAYVVVATQGRRDLQALRAALALSARQVSLVASARKASVLKDALRTAGADPAAVDAIVAPAGYPIAASTPEEIALSVLAALVAHRHGSPVASPAASLDAPAVESAAAAMTTSKTMAADVSAMAMMAGTVTPGSAAAAQSEALIEEASTVAGATTITAVARVGKPAGGGSCCGGG